MRDDLNKKINDQHPNLLGAFEFEFGSLFDIIKSDTIVLKS